MTSENKSTAASKCETFMEKNDQQVQLPFSKRKVILLTSSSLQPLIFQTHVSVSPLELQTMNHKRLNPDIYFV